MATTTLIPTPTTTSVPSADAATTGVRWRWLRFMYAANIVGAGVPGLLMVLAPDWAIGNLVPAPQDRVLFGMLGAIWLAIGALSVVGLRYPLQFAAVFVVQIVYKSIWLLAVALPLLAGGLAGGERTADVIPFAIFFGLVVACFAVGTPFAYLLTRRPVAAR